MPAFSLPLKIQMPARFLTFFYIIQYFLHTAFVSYAKKPASSFFQFFKTATSVISALEFAENGILLPIAINASAIASACFLLTVMVSSSIIISYFFHFRKIFRNESKFFSDILVASQSQFMTIHSLRITTIKAVVRATAPCNNSNNRVSRMSIKVIVYI